MAACKLCEDPLVFQIEDGDGADEVPDDLELGCGCHFHWQCFLDESPDIAQSLKCPSCQTYLATGEAGPSSSASGGPRPGSAILTQYKNEGGLQANLDILPAVTEEAYLSNNPEARPARAFQLMCSEGDVGGMVELLEDIDGAGDENISVLSVLRYQDPLSNMKTGLHLAIERGQVDVAFLLLWLCSSASDTEFPEDGRNTAQILGLGRLTLDGNADIRLLKDGNGLTASDYARQSTEPWSRFLNGGLL